MQGSVVHRINAERLVVVGWTRAILMQVAHPLIAAGVNAHSTFRASTLAPVRRLHGTVTAMLGLTFGSDEDQARVIAHIRGIHTQVHGTLRETVGPYPAGTRYSAEDPALVLWVHATLIDTSVRVYEALVGELTPADRDEYCRASAGVAVALGAVPEAVPRSWDPMCALVETTLRSGSLVVGADARELARALLHSRVISMTGPLAWASRQLTTGWLPDGLRQQYGLSWDARHQRRLQRLVRTIRRLRPWMPDAVAHWGGARHSLPRSHAPAA
jgi:uncharacterized protein (DUF2236 family)